MRWYRDDRVPATSRECPMRAYRPVRLPGSGEQAGIKSAEGCERRRYARMLVPMPLFGERKGASGCGDGRHRACPALRSCSTRRLGRVCRLVASIRGASFFASGSWDLVCASCNKSFAAPSRRSSASAPREMAPTSAQPSKTRARDLVSWRPSTLAPQRSRTKRLCRYHISVTTGWRRGRGARPTALLTSVYEARPVVGVSVGTSGRRLRGLYVAR